MRFMKKLIAISIVLIAFTQAKAQQLEQWTQFFLNEYMVNPAVSGTEDYFQANALYRDQWVGIQDAPRTYYLSVQGPIVKQTMGIGGTIFSDVVGQTRRNGFQASYAYHLKVSEDYKLSFALSTGMLQFAIDGSKIDLDQANDIALSSGLMSLWSLDFGSGVRFSAKNWHAGIYVPQIAGLKAQFFNDYSETESVLARHYYINGGYRYDFDDTWAIDANFLGKIVGSIDIYDTQVRGIYKDMVWLGSSIRYAVVSGASVQAIGFMTGYQFENNLSIGYAYDLNVGKIGAATSGSHEIVMGIRFNKPNKAPLIPAE